MTMAFTVDFTWHLTNCYNKRICKNMTLVKSNEVMDVTQ